MANFHSNAVAIAASEENMFGVLMTMAKNLTADEDNPLDMKEIEGITTADELYDAIESELECNYFCMFTPNPEGRGLSETADVEYKRRGAKRVLCLNYSTAWEMNWEDLAGFSANLPDGEYGIAVYDADEADDYAEITQTVYVIKVGAGDIDDTYTKEGCLSRSELKALQKETPALSRAKVKDLSLDGMANIVAVKSWYEWGFEDEEEDD